MEIRSPFHTGVDDLHIQRFGRDFVRMWAGEEYAFAYYMIVIMMIPTLISRSQSLGTQILLAKNKHKFRAIFYLVVVLADIAVSIPLAMWFGQYSPAAAGIGAALGTALATLIGPVIVMNIYYKKVMHLDIGGYFRSTVPILLEVAVLTALGFAMNTLWVVDGWLILGAQIVIYLLVFLPTIYFVSFNAYEKSLVQGIFKKFKRH